MVTADKKVQKIQNQPTIDLCSILLAGKWHSQFSGNLQ
jgi:hypothetical protein